MILKKSPKKNQKISKKSSLPEKKDIEALIKEDYVQDWIPVEKVQGEMIKLKESYGGYYVTVLEVEPTNFMMFDRDERESLLIEMFEWLHICPVSFQFQMMTNRANPNDLISYINDKNLHETDKRVKHRKDQYINKIRNLSSTEALRKRFFIIMRYEGRKSDDIHDIYSTMQTVKGTTAYYFNRMGNKVIYHDNENNFLTELLYQHFNPLSSGKESLYKRSQRIVTDYSNFYYDTYHEPMEDGDKIAFEDHISPRGFDNSNREYIIIDGMFTTFLYIRSDGYRPSVYPGWMEDITGFGEGIDVNVYVRRRNREKVEAESRRVSAQKSADTNLAERRDKMMDALGAALNADMIHNAIVEDNEDLFDVVTLITIKSTSLKDTFRKRDDIKTFLKSKSYKVEECYQHNEKAYLMSLPLLLRDKQISEKASRNFLTSSLASMYFFTAFELNDKDGVLLGVSASNSTIAVINFFNSGKYKNANSIILGTSGMGKTYMLQQLGYAFRVSGVPVSYILPYKGKEYKLAAKAINGEFISLAPSSKSCINIMAIRPQSEIDESLIDEEDDNSLLQSKIHKIITFIQLLKPKQEMTDVEEMQLNVVCTKLYADFDINEDNDSIWENKDKKILKPMPIIEDLYDRCVSDEILSQRVAVALRPFVEGTCKNMNGQTNVNLDNKYIIYDVSNAGDQFLPAFAFIATDCAYDQIKADRTENGVIIMDEVWKMMVNEYCAQYVRDMYKIIRGYGGAAISATQDISDFLSFMDGEYGKKIISNSRIKFILGMEKQEAELIAEVVGISDNDVKRIRKYDRGQVLMVANGEKIPINIKGTDEETYIFTTDPQKRRELKNLIAKNPRYLKDLIGEDE